MLAMQEENIPKKTFLNYGMIIEFLILGLLLNLVRIDMI